MLLTITWPNSGPSSNDIRAALFDFEDVREAEHWFGWTASWLVDSEGGRSLVVYLAVDAFSLVGRRPKENRIGYGSAAPYCCVALLGQVVWELGKLAREKLGAVLPVQITVSTIEHTRFSREIAERVFRPLGYELVWEAIGDVGATLTLKSMKGLGQVLREIAVLFTVFDRRGRSVLTAAELSHLAEPPWISEHPARDGIWKALAGEVVPVRLLLPPGFHFDRQRRIEELTDTTGIEAVASSFISLSDIQKEHAREVYRRLTVGKNWLAYLPAGVASFQNGSGPTLEHPRDALAYYREQGIRRAVVERKHMGSRGIAVICKSVAAGERRFGSRDLGTVYTRNGMKFFEKDEDEVSFLERLEAVLSKTNFWKQFNTDWACLDGEVLPWSFKANALEKDVDAAVVTLGKAVLAATGAALRAGDVRERQREHLLRDLERRGQDLARYEAVFQKYRSSDGTVASIQFAPFHLIAAEGRTFFRQNHLWHMDVLDRLAKLSGGFVVPTPFQAVDLSAERWPSIEKWWEELSSAAEEGLVVKPLFFVPQGRRGRCQPALKCRTAAHLRLVYGPGYDREENLERLRAREALTGRRTKFRKVLVQFDLSLGAVEKFVRGKPNHEVQAHIFAMLATDVAPVDLPQPQSGPQL